MNLHENTDQELLKSMREGLSQPLSGIPTRKDQENDAIPQIAPKWLKYDRQVSPPQPLFKIIRKVYLIC